MAWLLALSCSFTALSAQQAVNDAQPWDAGRLDAVVRIEAAGSIGTGFIIHGVRKDYVVTSGHVVFGRGSPTDASSDCIRLGPEIALFRRERTGERLQFDRCAWRLGSDVTLIALSPREQDYPALELAAREFRQLDSVFLAGYPNGFDLDFTRSGRVSTVRTPDNLVVTNALTMEGMSGGPYLSPQGHVVGIHTGGIQYRAGMAHFTAVGRIRTALEVFTGAIENEVEAPPDRRSVIAESRREARLGDLLALQIVEDPQTRIVLWQIFIGRPATEDEKTLLSSLPYSPIPNAGNETQLTRLATPGTWSDDGVAELQIATKLNDIKQQSQLRCLSGIADIGEDGILRCDGVSKYLPAKHSGTPSSNIPALVVLHYTATATLQAVVEIFRDPSFTSSAHFLIDRDGSIVQMVPTSASAYHAGRGRWQGLESLNRKSVGIELVNLGQLTPNGDGTYRGLGKANVPSNEVKEVRRDNGSPTYWHRFTSAQIASAEVISKAIASRYEIRAIVGHCSIDPRKPDPGPAFPLGDFGNVVVQRREPECPAIISPR